MLLSDVVALLEGQLVDEADAADPDVQTACGADLMSDVLTFVHSGSVLLTGLTQPQVVRTAEMVDVAVIGLVRGKVPPAETIALARERGIPVFTTPFTLFECCGRLYAAGVQACDVPAATRERFFRRLEVFRATGVVPEGVGN